MRSPRIFCLAALLFFPPLLLCARDVEITAEDEDLRLPLEGAVVQMRGGEPVMCDEDGKARLSVPDDRQVIVQVSYPGYESHRLLIAPAGADTAVERITVAMRLGGVMQGRELIIEAERPEASETKSGRSVAISGGELARTAEIGIMEDVMTSVKLLPGVGYSGMFNAMPSIRGGDPGDLMAALDGFYLERPYHWLGAVSIFDPKMVQSARLSHGVFSSRYGHTISGLLEVRSKSPSSTETELEAAVGSSAASLNLSVPLLGKGGLMFMGKVTYWDTLVWAAQGLSKVIENETLDLINAVSTSPYIRSAALSAHYRFAPELEWKLNGFFGSDGVGASFRTEYDDQDIQGNMNIDADYTNYQGFLLTGITASPAPVLALNAAAGLGFIETNTADEVDNRVTVHYTDEFTAKFPSLGLTAGDTYTAPNVNAGVEMGNSIFNAQARADLDWELGNGFLAAFGVQELYSRWKQREAIDLFLEIPLANLPPLVLALLPPSLFPIAGLEHAALIRPMFYQGDVLNQGFTTSAYALLEYASPLRRFGAEAGLRVDHLFFKGRDFSAQTLPALNPRLNLDLAILKNRGSVDSLTATAGTGLFSSMNNLVSFIEGDSGIGDYDLKMNRSWTSVVGLKLDMAQGYSVTLEGYYKRVFDRAYITADTTSSSQISPTFNFDGVGNVWGFDVQLQKMSSRYWDGWISYSFSWAKYYDPQSGDESLSSVGNVGGETAQWYYPSFHRFHNCNMVLNLKPLRWFNIAVRFGFASGQPKEKVGDTIYPYPVQMVDENYAPVIDENGNPIIIQKYERDSWYDENERTTWSLPLDMKFSFFLFDRKGRVNTEIYFAAENILSLVYTPSGNTSFNEYSGREDSGGGTNAFEMPIPLVSFGFKWRY